MFNHTLSAILRGRWLIDKQWADDHMLMVIGILKGQPLNVMKAPEAKTKQIKSVRGQSGYEEISMPYAIDPVTMQTYKAYVLNQDWAYIPNPNIPPNSVAIISISGPITKYNGDCGEPGAIQLAQYINEMTARENIGSIILLLDTPGGEARAANEIVTAIQNSTKPILSYVNGMCASLGVWLSSATRETYFSNKMDQIGSVGSYCTLFDFRGMLEMQGIKMHEIYAPQSVDKNKDYKDALDGDYTAIENDLKLHVDDFISFVQTNRPAAASNTSAWNSGKMFYAVEATKLGLADGIKPFSQVVSKAAWLGKRTKQLVN